MAVKKIGRPKKKKTTKATKIGNKVVKEVVHEKAVKTKAVKSSSAKGGQPMKFQSVEELQEQIDQFFNECKESKRPYTITGLALALDTNRQTLMNYEKEPGYEWFFDTIKKAKARVENYVEERLFGNQVAGPIFNLKNNFKNWKDKTETENTGEMTINVINYAGNNDTT